MYVWNFEPSDDECRPCTAECPNLGLTDPVGEGEQVTGIVNGQIRPAVDFHSRDDEDMARVDRIDGHDRHRAFVTMHEGAW